MIKEEVIARLRADEATLRAMGIEQLSIFGSTARGEASESSDVDLAITLRSDMRIGLVEYVNLEERLARTLGTKVDMVSEPARRPRLQAQIDRDRVRVF